MATRQKLNKRGIHHILVPLAIVVFVGVIGTFYYVVSHAQTTSDTGQIVGIDGKCLDNQDNRKVGYNKIQLYSCNGTGAQSWTITTAGTIVNSNGYCLDVYHGKKAVGTKVDLYRCNGTAAQKWTVNTTKKTIVNPHSGLCLDDKYARTANGNQIWIYSCNGTAAQKWTTPSSGGSGGSSGTASSEHIISTLYAYPTLSSWGQVEDAAPTVQDAIVNICAPDGTGSGCGSPADEANPAWDSTIQALNTAGITPLYYISTNYGAESLSTLESELQDARTWYGIASPMYDTVSTSSTCSNGGDPISCTTYYDDLYTNAVNNGATIVEFNSGTIPSESYMFGSKEVIQVFEGTAAGFESTSFPTWMSNYPASEFAATLSVGTSTTVGTDVTDAVNDHIGNFYEDDEAESPNYATLPAFWSTEVTDVADAK